MTLLVVPSRLRSPSQLMNWKPPKAVVVTPLKRESLMAIQL